MINEADIIIRAIIRQVSAKYRQCKLIGTISGYQIGGIKIPYHVAITKNQAIIFWEPTKRAGNPFILASFELSDPDTISLAVEHLIDIFAKQDLINT